MLSDEAKGFTEAVDNAVEYFTEKGLRPTDILELLSNLRHAWKERFIAEAASAEVDRLLEDIFNDGRGTE